METTSTSPGCTLPPSRVLRLGGRVHPGKVEVVSPAVAGIAVPPHPTPGRDRVVLTRLGLFGERRNVLPGAILGPVRDDVGGEADRVLAVSRMDRVGGIAVRDEDVVAALHPADVRQQPAVDLLPREAGDVDEAPAAHRLAEVAIDQRAPHLGGRRGCRRCRDHDDHRKRDQGAQPTAPCQAWDAWH